MAKEKKPQTPRDIVYGSARDVVAKKSAAGGFRIQDAFTIAMDAIKNNPNFSVQSGMSAENLDASLIRSDSTSTASVFDAADLSNKLIEKGIPLRQIPSLVQECFDYMDSRGVKVQDVVLSAGVGGTVSLGDVLGAGGMRGLGEANQQMAQGMSAEAWGVDINTRESDERTSFAIAINRAATSIEDKLFGRIPVTENVATVTWSAPSAYDFAATNTSISTIKDADPTLHQYIDMQSDPRFANPTPKPMIPNPAADVDGVLWTDSTNTPVPDSFSSPLIKVGTECNLKKLCLVDGKFGYDQSNLTDLISPGGVIKTVRVSVNDGTNPAEFYDITTDARRRSGYYPALSQELSGDVQAQMPVTFILNSASTDIYGNVSKIAAGFTTVSIVKKMTVSSGLNLQYGNLTSSVSVANVNEVVPETAGAVVPDATTQAAKKLKITIEAFNPGQSFAEDNFRKSNMALQVNYGQNKVSMPRPINFFTDYSLGQEDDPNIVEITAGVMNLGNSYRTISIASGAMSDVATASNFVQTSGVDRSQTALADLSLTHTVVRPIVFTTTLDFTKETVNLMDESTRGKQVSGRLINRLVPMIADVVAQSLIGLTYADGEPMVFKVLAHSYLADVLFGMYDYIPQNIADRPASLPTGASFSITLPNGTRLDVVKVVWKTMENKIALFPTKDGDSTALTNFGVIFSRGIASYLFNPTFDGATWRRSVACQRELFVPTTIVALAVRVKGLADQLGSYGYDPIDLTTYTAADIADTVSNRTIPAVDGN